MYSNAWITIYFLDALFGSLLTDFFFLILNHYCRALDSLNEKLTKACTENFLCHRLWYLRGGGGGGGTYWFVGAGAGEYWGCGGGGAKK